MDSSRFFTSTLRTLPQGEAICRILAESIDAVDPGAAVTRLFSVQDNILSAGGNQWDLSYIKRIFVVGAGKAGAPMTMAASEILGDRLTAGIVIVKDGYITEDMTFPGKVRLVQARHPIPDIRGVEATAEIRKLLSATTQADLVVCLLSGGASSLMTSPAEGITLTDLQRMTDLLLRSGANILEINTLRKHLDSVKGGGLALAAAPAQIIALILSDVVGDPLDVIASGPTTPDASTFKQAIQIIKDYKLEDKLAPAIIAYLQRGVQGEIRETLKPGDSIFESVTNVLIGGNRQAALAGLDAARRLGFNTQLLTLSMQGDARQAGQILAGIAQDIASGHYGITRPACIIAGGETTVKVRGSGRGGRNQEVGLAAVRGMSGLNNMLLVTLATDGNDGPTDAAGAVVSADTLARAQALGLSPVEYLVRNDAYPFFAALDDLLKPGPTCTNVNDLAFLFAF